MNVCLKKITEPEVNWKIPICDTDRCLKIKS